MSQLSNIKVTTLGNIAAMQTLLERYPVMLTVNSLKSISGSTTSFNFMFDILQIIGVDNRQLLEWASNLIVGDGESGVLDVIESIVKTALKLNVKNILSCSVNPIIPDELLDSHTNDMGIETEGPGIEIDLNSVDYSGKLRTAPTSEIGRFYYFDNNYTPNNLYKSCDFDTFLWYCINKGLMTSENDEKYKMVWDNRNKIKIKNHTEEGQKDFYDSLTKDSIADYNKSHTPKKKQIIQCQFVERDFPYGNKLKVQLCSSTYYKARKLFNANPVGDVKMNKTIFEFNNDYIDSLKLFNSKVLMAQIVDKLTGTLSFNVGYSINEIVTQGKIDKIVKKIIEADDTEISDCFYTFSNDEYDSLMQEAALKHAGLYKFSGDNDTAVPVNGEELLQTLTGITENSTLQEQKTTIENTFTEVSASLAEDGSISVSDSFNFGVNIIFQLINQIIYAIISAILTPKVMILLAINSRIMGDDRIKSFDELFEGLGNLIIATIKEIKDVIVKELFKFLMNQIMPLIELYISKLVLESIKFYKELLNNLLDLLRGFLGFGGGNKVQSVIDNVNYADIIPQQTVPEISC